MKFVDLFRINYQSALSKQLAIVKDYQGATVLFCEHEPCVYTAGKRLPDFAASPDAARLQRLGADCHNTNRGGLLTWHGAGQLTVYPIIDISGMGMREYVRRLETVIIQVGERFGVPCERMCEVGVATKTTIRRKFGFIGVAQSHGISFHGIAINVSNDLDWFNNITPCGMEGLVVTSLERETGKKIEMDAVKETVKHSFTTTFTNDINKQDSRQ